MSVKNLAKSTSTKEHMYLYYFIGMFILPK